MITRRQLLRTTATVAAGSALLARAVRADESAPNATPIPPGGLAPAEPGRDYRPVVVPNGTTLPWRIVDGVKVGHLIAEPVRHEVAPGLTIDAWGYNGRTPGPVIEAVEGDRLRLYVTNRLPEPTSVHWHGLVLPCGMDGVSALTQPPIPIGQTFRYDFTLRQSGTQMYHPHYDEMVQMAMGMMGMFVIHPRGGDDPAVDRDFAVMLSEWTIKPGTRKTDVSEMSDFNVLTMNSRAFPGTDPLVAKRGQRLRIRLGNLGATDHHPIHIHGHRFLITGTDAGRIPRPAQWPAATVLVPVGTTRDIEFVADAAGDWALHCHMTHHVMNQMGHRLPNMMGVDPKGIDPRLQRLLPEYMTMGDTGMGAMTDMRMAGPANSIAMRGTPGPFGTIDMGGMFTVIKVRDELASYDDPGWYAHPRGSVATVATPEDLRADGIEL